MSIFDNDRVLGSLRERDPETYRALVDWHKAGKPVEIFLSGGWEKDEGRLHGHLTYRAVREPPTVEEVERLRLHVGSLEARIRALEDAARPPVLPADPDPQPGLIVDPLVWRVLDRRLRWITVDVEGERWSYPLKPKAGKTMWENAPDSDYQSLDAIAPNLIRMTGDWREAIAERPEGL